MRVLLALADRSRNEVGWSSLQAIGSLAGAVLLPALFVASHSRARPRLR